MTENVGMAVSVVLGVDSADIARGRGFVFAVPAETIDMRLAACPRHGQGYHGFARAAEHRLRQHAVALLRQVGRKHHIVQPVGMRTVAEGHAYRAAVFGHRLAERDRLQGAVGHLQPAVVHHCLAIHHADMLAVQSHEDVLLGGAPLGRNTAEPDSDNLQQVGPEARHFPENLP